MSLRETKKILNIDQQNIIFCEVVQNFDTYATVRTEDGKTVRAGKPAGATFSILSQVEVRTDKKVYTIETIEDFWIFFGNFHDFQKFQFYVMRGDILPTYEDEANLNGGSYSYMIPGREVNKSFVLLMAKMIGEQLVAAVNHDEIKGVSLVPKKGLSVLKVWMKNKNNPLCLNVGDINGLTRGRFQPHKF